MRISRHRRPQRQEQINFRINEEIRVPQLRVVDDEGKFLGVMPTNQALDMARSQEKDLIEIVPKGDIPVAKITDYGRFKYQKEKEMRKQKAQQKTVDVKGIRLSLRIGKHDIDLRVNQAVEFLNDGDKVRIDLMLRGREKARRDLCEEIIKNFIKSVEQKKPIKVEQPLTSQGGKFSVIIVAK